MLRAFKGLGGSATAFALLLVVVAAPAVAAQAERQIDCGVAVESDAIVIVKVMVGSAQIQCYAEPGKSGRYEPAPPFPADDDWLKDLTITFFNRTNKTVAYGLVSLSFPQTQPERATNIGPGIIPASALHRQLRPIRQDPSRKPLSFGPNQTLVLHVSEYIDSIKGGLEPVLFAPVTKVKVHFVGFYFEDGMHWNPGSYDDADPEHPGQSRHMPAGYFPGDRGANWPPERILGGR